MTALPVEIHQSFAMMRMELYRSLDKVEFLMELPDKWDEERVASTVRDLLQVIRGLVVLHNDDGHGGCQACGRRVRGLRARRVSWPCDVVSTVHRLLKNPDSVFTSLSTR
jgi:hypothetical protein